MGLKVLRCFSIDNYADKIAVKAAKKYGVSKSHVIEQLILFSITDKFPKMFWRTIKGKLKSPGNHSKQRYANKK